MLTPDEYHIIIPQGGTYDQPFLMEDDEGNLIDTSVYDQARWQIREEITSATTIVSKTNGDGGVVIDANGFTLKLTAAETAALDFATACYDVELVTTGATEIVDRPIHGPVTLVLEVTR